MRDLPNRNPIVTYWVKTLASTRDVANDLRRSLSEKLRFERFVVPGGNPRCGFVDEVGAVAAAGRDEVAFRVFLSLLDQLTTLSSRQFAEATGADPSLTRLARYDPLVCGLVEWHRSRLFAVRGERSYSVGVHAALFAALRSRIRAL